ncbi:hypothetical protein POPTR_001G024200v4 [Populus trichocarpa]|uniref:Uncharacterized protein n=1 Tax=Populus trichocarpa TaxID=3694 RepID=A0A2K2BR78_POPTR|nr:uncharacterized protein LOC7496009 [Populus trichocarpa]PNT52291.1 hypothetical protein POPTR_001G024200v4 [Populus trichocarpa]|eukprot:XP_006368596.2 uncharacterized protein LOC7496009 isoform X1 [Populus trichocarpa]
MASLHVQHSWLSSLTKNPTTLFSSKASPFKVSLSLNSSNAESPNPSSQNPPDPEPGPVDPVKLAFEKAKAYRNSIETSKNVKIEQNPVEDSGGSIIGIVEKNKQVSDPVKGAVEYKTDIGVVGSSGVVEGIADSKTNSGLKGRNLGSGVVDKTSKKEQKLSISSIDFVGLEFADKKKGRGLPAGLVPITDPFSEGNLPDVEIIVGDTSKFEDPSTLTSKPTQEDNPDLYKPKVSTWGVFPRPGNISKTFGGGKTIRPGDELETAEARAAKDERTKQLIAAYRKSIGLNVDPNVKLECEKALKDGDSLMDSGKLNDALPYYQMVLDKLPFKSELHGLAALQWSICQDSLSRPNEARAMYEKLQSHPNVKVSKIARQFMFSFQAMEKLKFTGSNFSPTSTGYQYYFEKFVEDKTSYPQGEAGIEIGVLNQALPYMIFLVSPIFMVLFAALRGGNTN